LQYDPSNLSAMNNLGTLLARDGKISAAAELWSQAFQLNEDIESLGLNLATAYCREGLKDKTEQVLRRILVYSPGSVTANRKLRLIEAGQESCGPVH
jgi:Flp pilus assembly protein TadD